jgi:hypothetical protein
MTIIEERLEGSGGDQVDVKRFLGHVTYFIARGPVEMNRVRLPLDRRSGADRRKMYRLRFLIKGGVERRSGEERRARNERRQGWVRVGKWSSVRLDGLKLAKFLKQPTPKGSSDTGR